MLVIPFLRVESGFSPRTNVRRRRRTNMPNSLFSLDDLSRLIEDRRPTGTGAAFRREFGRDELVYLLGADAKRTGGQGS